MRSRIDEADIVEFEIGDSNRPVHPRQTRIEVAVQTQLRPQALELYCKIVRQDFVACIDDGPIKAAVDEPRIEQVAATDNAGDLRVDGNRHPRPVERGRTHLADVGYDNAARIDLVHGKPMRHGKIAKCPIQRAFQCKAIERDIFR